MVSFAAELWTHVEIECFDHGRTVAAAFVLKVADDPEVTLMLTANAFAEIGALLGDPGRANMLVALMDGRALTATELAGVAGVTPQTASSHLGQLISAGLIAMERQGRHRYHQLATPAIARMVEDMMAVATATTATRRAPLRTGPRDLAMRQARTCYDHLAGRIAVAIADAMTKRGDIELGADGGALTQSGGEFLDKIGLALPTLTGRKRVFCRPCLDWSERRLHIAGTLGSALLDHMLDKAWLRKLDGSRAVKVTSAGRRELTRLFDLDSSVW